MTADEIIDILQLEAHPEGGFYHETWRHNAGSARSAGTAIYFLLKAGQTSRWHRVDSTEIWHHYAGDPLELVISATGKDTERHVLGTDLASGQRPQWIVAPHAWQSASTLGVWTLVGCTVSPGFVFDGFEMAPQDWQPGAHST
jgi:uncharacterized protein